MTNLKMIAAAALLGIASFASSPSFAQQSNIYSTPGLGAWQFQQQRPRLMMPRQFVILPQQQFVQPMQQVIYIQQPQRRLVWIKSCGIFLCQMRQVWINQ